MDATNQLASLRRAYAHRPFGVLSVSRQTKHPGKPVRYPTIHSALVFPVRGRALFVLDEETLIGEPGVVLHGCPNRRLRFESVGEEPFEHVNIYYAAGPNEGTDPCGWMDRAYCFRPRRYDELLDRVEAIEAMGMNPTFESRLNQLVGAARLINGMFSFSPDGREGERMEPVRAYLENHFDEDVSLADLAHVAGVSERRVSSLFQRAYGVRPLPFLIGLRLDHAARLLESGALVKDAAAAVGYRDPLYFSRLFKRHFGYPPQSVSGLRKNACPHG